jgi:hypothetical protein
LKKSSKPSIKQVNKGKILRKFQDKYFFLSKSSLKKDKERKKKQ